MTSTMAIWAFLAILSGYSVWRQLGLDYRLNRQQEEINRLTMFARGQKENGTDIEALHWRTGNLISEHSDLERRVRECERKLGALTAAIDYLAAGPLDTSALILEHLGLEIQEPTTTPRRLVPKDEERSEK